MFKRMCWLLAVILLPLMWVAAGFSQARGMMGETAVTAAPYDVIISEVAWGGTSASSTDEWIELYNNTNDSINLSSWTLNTARPNITILLTGTIPGNGFYLLERTDDATLSNIPADQIYTGALSNTGEQLFLRDNSSELIDSAGMVFV